MPAPLSHKERARVQQVANSNAPTKPGERVPKSMVIRIGAGHVGPSVSQLVKDVRQVMEPYTASRLKERKANKLRDFTTMAGPLGVTHLFLFSRSENGNTNLRIGITPRGPTLHFRVSNYSLCKDIVKSLKRAKSGGVEHTTSPLLVMNNLVNSNDENCTVPKHLESLMTTVFQSLFAPIAPQTTPLKSIKRLLLLDRVATKSKSDDPPYVLNFRHYSIATPTAKSSLPRALRRLNAASKVSHPSRKHMPNLGRLDDVSDFLLDPTAAGFTSASDTEQDTDAEVEVLAEASRKVLSKDERQKARDVQRSRIEQNDLMEGISRASSNSTRRPRVERKAIKLTELGPRMTLRLTKIEEGLCGGKVMWHEYIHKTKAEMAEMERSWSKRRQEKEERRRIQKENVERKKKERLASGKPVVEEEEDGVDPNDVNYDDYDMDDDFWEGDDDDDAVDQVEE